MAGTYTLAIRLDEDLEFGIRWGNEETNTWYELSSLTLKVITDDDGSGTLLLDVPTDVGTVDDGITPEWWYTVIVPADDIVDKLAGVLNGAMGEAYFAIHAVRASDSRKKTLAAGSAVIHRGTYIDPGP